MTTSTDDKWVEELIVELRLRDVDGPTIGDTVASARELLNDTGQSAEEVFGSAREYAAAMAPRGATTRWASSGLWYSVVGLLAFLTFTAATTPWLNGTPLLLSLPQLGLLGVIVVMVATLPLYLGTLLRRPWLFVPFVLVGAASGALSAVVAPTSTANALFAAPPLPLLVVSGVVMLLASIRSTVLALRSRERDQIVEPLEPMDGPRRGRGWGGAILIVHWMFPIYAGLMLAVSSLLTR